MKVLPRVLLAGILVVLLLVPLVATSDQILAPLDKKIPPGVTSVTYGGQTLRFTTDVKLSVNLSVAGEGRIRLRVLAAAPQSPGGSSVPSANTLNIYWQDWSTDVYNGPPPLSVFETILLTESGFTEK